MRTKWNRSSIGGARLILFLLAGISWEVLAGSNGKVEKSGASNSAATSDSSSQLSGQELWSMNCQRCHNMRSPIMYNSARWEIIVHHMRVRANITGADARAIAEFLKSGSP